MEQTPVRGKPAFPIMTSHRKCRSDPAEKKRRPPLTNAETAAGPLPERLPYAAIRGIVDSVSFRNDTLVYRSLAERFRRGRGRLIGAAGIPSH